MARAASLVLSATLTEALIVVEARQGRETVRAERIDPNQAFQPHTRGRLGRLPPNPGYEPPGARVNPGSG
jgi:hypothetical protein